MLVGEASRHISCPLCQKIMQKERIPIRNPKCGHTICYICFIYMFKDCFPKKLSTKLSEFMSNGKGSIMRNSSIMALFSPLIFNYYYSDHVQGKEGIIDTDSPKSPSSPQSQFNPRCISARNVEEEEEKRQKINKKVSESRSASIFDLDRFDESQLFGKEYECPICFETNMVHRKGVIPFMVDTQVQKKLAGQQEISKYPEEFNTLPVLAQEDKKAEIQSNSASSPRDMEKFAKNIKSLSSMINVKYVQIAIDKMQQVQLSPDVSESIAPSTNPSLHSSPNLSCRSPITPSNTRHHPNVQNSANNIDNHSPLIKSLFQLEKRIQQKILQEQNQSISEINQLGMLDEEDVEENYGNLQKHSKDPTEECQGECDLFNDNTEYPQMNPLDHQSQSTHISPLKRQSNDPKDLEQMKKTILSMLPSPPSKRLPVSKLTSPDKGNKATSPVPNPFD